jgi:hypothetical protein
MSYSSNGNRPKLGEKGLLTPDNCVVALIDHQPEMLFGTSNFDRQTIIVQAQRCAGKRIVTSGFKPTPEFLTRGNSLRRVSRAATSITGHCGPATSSRGRSWHGTAVGFL